MARASGASGASPPLCAHAAGAGTQELLLRRDGILFCSLHQSPLYPGTGEAQYLRALEPSLAKLLDFKPDVLAVSAGFDTYRDCPIAQLRLEKITYRRIGALLAQTHLRRFAVLEGGYAPDPPVLIENFLDGFFG